jgi:OmpA-OmpF porin, OOP family
MQRWIFGAGIAMLAGAAATAPANAQVYAAVGGGWSRLGPAQTQVDNGVSSGVGYSMNVKTGSAASFNGALGFDFGALRLEGEYRHASNGNSRYDAQIGTTGASRPLDGSITTDSLMANIYYDFSFSGITPYVGAGFGAVKGDVELIGARPTALTSGTVRIVDDANSQFGLQAMAGFAVPLAGNMSLTAQFRYFDDGTLDLHDTLGNATHLELKGDSWDLGLRFGF